MSDSWSGAESGVSHLVVVCQPSSVFGSFVAPVRVLALPVFDSAEQRITSRKQEVHRSMRLA